MDHETRVAIRTGLKMATAHHPLCQWFRADVFGRRVPVCSGCAVTWPTFLVMAPVSVAMLAFASPWALFAAGWVLGLPQASTLLWRGGRVWRAVVKGLGGAGLAMVVVGAIAVPVPASWKWIGLGLLTVAFTGFMALRLKSILKTCDACPWKRDWANCPGFGMQEMQWGPVLKSK